MSAKNVPWIQTRPVAARVVYQIRTATSVRTDGWTTRRTAAVASAVAAATTPTNGQLMSAASANAPAAPVTYEVVSRNATPAARDARSPRPRSHRPSPAKTAAARRAMAPIMTSGSGFEPAARPMKALHAAIRNAPPR